MASPQRSLAVLALVAVVLAGVVAPAGGTGLAPIQGGGAQQAQAVDADSVRMAVDLGPDGDATWTITYRVRLEDDNETAAFESLRADVDTDPENYTGRFGDRMRSTAAAAEAATGREMAVRNVTVDARIQELGRTYGILEYTFVWTNFAAVDEGTVTAGDALAGLFLDDGTTLVVAWPDGYGLVEVRPEADPDVGDEHSAGWAGPREFGDEEPRVVVSPEGGGDDAGLPTGLLAGVGLAAVGVLAVAAWYRRRGGEAASSTGEGSGGATVGGVDGAGEAAAASEEPPEELLSNEEKVLRLVRERGGRIKQQEIVAAFDWTEAKTSQVVRDLRDEGELEGFRLGRENVLRLPGEDEEG